MFLIQCVHNHLHVGSEHGHVGNRVSGMKAWKTISVCGLKHFKATICFKLIPRPHNEMWFSAPCLKSGGSEDRGKIDIKRACDSKQPSVGRPGEKSVKSSTTWQILKSPFLSSPLLALSLQVLHSEIGGIKGPGRACSWNRFLLGNCSESFREIWSGR